MLNPRLASRYAKSLLDIATEQNSVEETLKDMQLIDAVVRHNRDFVVMMRSPVIKADKKISIINAVFAGKITPLTLTFIQLLINKGREQNIDEIATAFISQYRESKKIKMVTLTTATSVNTAVVDTLKAKLAAAFNGSSIEVETKVDPSLLGGFVLDMGDRQLDASILRDLNDIRKQFTKNLYVSQL